MIGRKRCAGRGLDVADFNEVITIRPRSGSSLPWPFTFGGRAVEPRNARPIQNPSRTLIPCYIFLAGGRQLTNAEARTVTATGSANGQRLVVGQRSILIDDASLGTFDFGLFFNIPGILITLDYEDTSPYEIDANQVLGLAQAGTADGQQVMGRLVSSTSSEDVVFQGAQAGTIFRQFVSYEVHSSVIVATYDRLLDGEGVEWDISSIDNVPRRHRRKIISARRVIT